MHEFQANGERYIARVEPTGVYASPLTTFSNTAALVASLRRLLTRDRTFTLTVRRRADDPFGDCVYTEKLPSRAEAHERADQVVAAAQAGNPPWSTSRS